MNGYKNWETWNVMLWAQNDEPIYRRVEDFLRGSKQPVTRMAVRAFFLGHIFPNGTPDMEKGWRGDMAKVDWYQITHHLNEWND